MSKKVIVVGAGFTGLQLARTLVAEGVHVVLVDRDPEKVQHARNALDCTVVESDGNSPETLSEAGIATADALVTLTDDDEMNMIVCSLVDADYPDVLKIARVRNYAYYLRTTATASRHADATASGERRPLFGVDHMLNPDVEAAAAITRAMSLGAVGNVIELGGGYGIVSLPVVAGGPFDGVPICRLSKMPGWHYLVAYVESDKTAVLPNGNTMPEAGDRVGVLVSLEDLPSLMLFMGRSAEEILRTVTVFGADRVGTLVVDHHVSSRRASVFSRIFGNSPREKTREMTIVDRDPHLCREAAERFSNVRVLCGDMTDADLVREESLDAVDLMVAASGNYESNLVMAAYLKSRGVKKTIALTASSDFDDVARKLGVDVAVPMRDTVVDCIVSHLRGDNVKSIHAVCNRFFEIVECEVSPSSRAAGKALSELVNDGEFLALLVQEKEGGRYSMPNGSTVIAPGARIVLVVKAGAGDEVQLFTGEA